MEGNNTYGLSDIAALMQNRGDNFLEGNGIVILILFFLIFGFAGNGWGNNNGALQGALTRSDLYAGLDAQDIKAQLRGITNGMCDGFYAQNTTMLNGFNTLAQEVNNNRFAAQQCCCETNRNIDSVKSEAYKNTCEITTAIHAEGEATRALINQNTMQALRDKLVEKDQSLQTANFQLSQQAQTANIINTLQPVAKPAYLTCSPYQSNYYASNGWGNCWNGCGCGNY